MIRLVVLVVVVIMMGIMIGRYKGRKLVVRSSLVPQLPWR